MGLSIASCPAAGTAAFHGIMELHHNTADGARVFAGSVAAVSSVITVAHGAVCATCSAFTDICFRDVTAGR